MYHLTPDQYFEVIKRGLLPYGYNTVFVDPTVSESGTPYMYFTKNNEKVLVAYNLPDGDYLQPDLSFEWDTIVGKVGEVTFFDRFDFVNECKNYDFADIRVLVDSFVKAVRDGRSMDYIISAFKQHKDEYHDAVMSKLMQGDLHPAATQAQIDGALCFLIGLYGDEIRNMKSHSDIEAANVYLQKSIALRK